MLAEKINETNDLTELSRWSYEIFLDCQRDIEPDLRGLLLDLARMEDGLEFEYSIDELRWLTKELQESDKDISVNSDGVIKNDQ